MCAAPPARPSFAQLDDLLRVIDTAGSQADVRVACEVDAPGRRFPVHVITLGSADPSQPAIGFFGGVHGLERIGAEVVIAYLRSVVVRLRWDDLLHRQLEALRMVFMPIVNPGGMWRGTRANPKGVDLMRNAPVESRERVPLLLGGQRLSASLPWYRGPVGAPMEPEAAALCRVVSEELLGRPFSLAIDCHSGFGIADRIWFPYAHSSVPPAHLAELHALKDTFDQTHAQHRYVFEPQSRQYLTHGDLWDHLYLAAASRPGMFLPLTLEMGSWTWVKKNPRQLFSRDGMFNPRLAHRQQRVLRRHLAWLDFAARATGSHRRWLPRDEARDSHHQRAMSQWYEAPDVARPA